MKILNFGSCNIDYVYTLDHIVQGGETEAINSLEIFPGGKGLNQSVAIARAGAPVYHAGCIGEGGEFFTQILTQNGVDISHLKQLKVKNGHAIIQVSSDGENAIFALHNGQICFSNKAKGRISVFSHNDVSKGVCEKGLLYSLDNYDLDNKTSIGSGNSFIGKKAEISVDNGTLLIYTSKKNLDCHLTK